MPEALQAATVMDQLPALGDLVARLGAALLFGMLVAVIYRFVRRGHPAAPSFLSTLVLLAVLIAMVTQIIGDNIARAFSLVGALSIVRFRTVVQDTQDTAYVIFSVAVGMAAGANHYSVALVGLVAVTLAAVAMRPWSGGANTRFAFTDPGLLLILRVALTPHPERVARLVMDAHLERHSLRSAGTVRQGGAIELRYDVWLRDSSSLGELVAELNQVEGVQSAEVKRVEPPDDD